MTAPFDLNDFTIEGCIDFTPEGRIGDIRITRGQARYGLLQRLRNWLYHRAPWLPRWVTGWTALHFRKPEVPFPGDPYKAVVSLLLHELDHHHHGGDR